MQITNLKLHYLRKKLLFKLIYRKNAAHFIKLYKSHNIIRYTNNNYAKNPKD